MLAFGERLLRFQVSGHFCLRYSTFARACPGLVKADKAKPVTQGTHFNPDHVW